MKHAQKGRFFLCTPDAALPSALYSSDNTEADTCQSDKLANACAIIFQLAQHVIALVFREMLDIL